MLKFKIKKKKKVFHWHKLEKIWKREQSMFHFQGPFCPFSQHGKFVSITPLKCAGFPEASPRHPGT